MAEAAPEAQPTARPPRRSAIERMSKHFSFGMEWSLPPSGVTGGSAHGFTALEGPACLCASILEGATSFEEELAPPSE